MGSQLQFYQPAVQTTWGGRFRPMSLSFLRLSVWESCGPRPSPAWETTLAGPFGQSALCCKVENPKEFLIMGLLGGGRDELGPRIVDYVEDPGKAELTGVDTAAARSHAHNGSYEVVRCHGDQQFLFQHVVAFGVDVMKPYGALQGA